MAKAKPTNAIQMLSQFLIQEWERNYREKGYKGLSMIYGGYWSICKKYSGIQNPELLLQELNRELEKEGFRIVPDAKVKMKLVKVSKEEAVKKDVEERFEKFMKQFK